MSSSSELWSTAVTEPPGPTRCASVIPGSPVPLARSRTRMPGNGREYSTRSSVTALPSTADFDFHVSAATRRYEELHGAGFEADTSGLFFTRLLAGRCGSGLGERRFGGCCFRNRCFRNRGSAWLWLRQQLRGLQALGRLPESFEVVELARFFRENMDDEVHIIKQHPLRLFVALGVCHSQAQILQALVHRVSHGLDLARIGAAAHHTVGGES